MSGSSSERSRWSCWWPVAWAIFLGILPHVSQRFAHGTWLYLADDDDHYYSMIARAPFFGSWALRDPFASTREAIGVSYAWGLFVPMAKLVALVASNPSAFLLAWRAFGGALLGGGLWFLMHTLFRRSGPNLRWLAGPLGLAGLSAVVATILLADPGFDHASLPFERMAWTAGTLLSHGAPMAKPGNYLQFRIVSPLCALGVLFVLLALLSRPRLRVRSAVVSGLLLGVLFNWYFFYWTTAVGLLGVLVVVQWLPARVRRWFGVRQSPKLLALTLLIGFALGLAQFLSDLSSFGDPTIKEALERTPRGLLLSSHNPERWVYLTSPRLWFALLLMVLAALRVRALRIPLLLVAIGFLLANSALVTSLQFENYKWLHAFQTVTYLSMWVWGLIEGARILRRRCPSSASIARAALAAVVAAAALIALVWIPWESLTAHDAAERTRWQLAIQGIEPVVSTFASDALVVAPLEAQPALLFASCGVLYEPSHSVLSFISDRDFIERHVLSAWVLGEDRSRLDLHSYLLPTLFGEKRARWSHVREDYARAVRDTPETELDKYRVRYALTRCERPPSSETGNWRLLARSKPWCAWERLLRP
jgi:hypothetical protein